MHVTVREICDGNRRTSAFLTTKFTRSDRLVCLSRLLELARTSGPHTYSGHDLLRLYITTRRLPAVVSAVRSHGLWTTCCLHSLHGAVYQRALRPGPGDDQLFDQLFIGCYSGCRSGRHRPPPSSFSLPRIHPDRHLKPQGRNLDFGFINIRSLGNKLDSLLDVRRDKNIDVLFLAETWHDCDSVSIRRLRVELGCQVVDRPRPRARHDTLATNYGGVAAVAFHGVRLTQLDIGVKPTTFEFVCMRFVASTSSCVAAVLYSLSGSQCVTKICSLQNFVT